MNSLKSSCWNQISFESFKQVAKSLGKSFFKYSNIFKSVNLVQLRSLQSWQCKLDSDYLIHKLSFPMGGTDWEGKSKNLFRRSSQNT